MTETTKTKMTQEEFSTKVIDALKRDITQGEFAAELNIDKKVLTSKLAALKKVCPGARIKFKRAERVGGSGAKLAEMFRNAALFDEPKTTTENAGQ